MILVAARPAAAACYNSNNMNFTEHRSLLEAAFEYSDKRRQGLGQLLTAFKERASIETDSAKRLERLVGMSFAAFNTPSLVTFLGALRMLWQTEAAQSRILAESIEKELIQPLAFLASLQTDEYKSELKQVKQRFKHVKDLMAKHDKSKGKYYKACHDTEHMVTNLEDGRYSEENRRKLIGKVEIGRREIVACEEDYENCVSELESYEPDYSTLQAISMAALAKQEHARGERLQADFKKLVTLEITKARKITNEKDQIESILDQFDRDSETLLYVTNSSQQVPTLRSPPHCPYSGNHPLFRKGTLRMMRLGEDWMDLVRSQTRNVNAELEVLVSRAWHGDIFQESDMQTVRLI